VKSRSFAKSENPGQQKDSQKYWKLLWKKKGLSVKKLKKKLLNREKFVKQILKLRRGFDT
jgi:hypothetical protein